MKFPSLCLRAFASPLHAKSAAPALIPINPHHLLAQSLFVSFAASGQMSLSKPGSNPTLPVMSKWINSTLQSLALLALLVSGIAAGGHQMPPDASIAAPHAMHMSHAEPHGDTLDHNLPDPVCKQHCLGMATLEGDVALGHDPLPRLETPVVSQAQVTGLRPALPDPPPKTAV